MNYLYSGARQIGEIDLPLDWRSDAVGRLTDLSGRLVASFALQSGQIDLSNVAAGSYFVNGINVHSQTHIRKNIFLFS